MSRMNITFFVSLLLHALILAAIVLVIPNSQRLIEHTNINSFVELLDSAAVLRPAKKNQDSPLKNVLVKDVEPKTAESAAPAPIHEQISTSSFTSESKASAENRYAIELAKILNQNKQYPREAELREQEGRVIIEVSVDRDGGLHESKIDVPSPYRLLNEEALATIARIGKFPPPPKTLLVDAGPHGIGSLRLKIPISFQIQRR